MQHGARLFFVAFVFWAGMVGCGTHPLSTPLPGDGSCTGVLISGALKDSLTGQPVAQGQVFLESGTQIAQLNLLNFSPAKQVLTSSDGTFQICIANIVGPSAIVAVASDSSGNAYPPFVAPVSGPGNLGAIPMGSCQLKCLDGQQQSSAPATITGAITTAPTSEAGTVTPVFPMNAPDGSGNLWNILIPTFNVAEPATFTTTAAACSGESPFCASYRFVLPSQQPLWPFNGGYRQIAGPPVYLIYATAPACTLPALFTPVQKDGQSELVAAPGSQLVAQTMNFTQCK